jgi:hypothetical protein
MIQVARLTTSDQSVAPGYSRRFILIFGVPAMVANDSADRTAAQAPGCTPGNFRPDGGRARAAAFKFNDAVGPSMAAGPTHKLSCTL